jgi:hypothetical protein
MLNRFGLRVAHAIVLFLPLGLVACGGDDDKKTTAPVAEEENEGGAPAIPPSYPPALGPEDCVDSISDLSLSQPEGAAVWGGLVVLDFKAPGNTLDSFDIQAYDSSLGVWTNYYVNVQAQGQRENGDYFMAVVPYYSDANKDLEMKLRVRPSQTGCPDAQWVESEPFTAGDPLVGTTWRGDVDAASLSEQLTLNRYTVPSGTFIDQSRLSVGNATLVVEFGKKGVFTESVSIPISTTKEYPWDGCTLGLVFTGSYVVKVRPNYGGVAVGISDAILTSYDDTTCDLPRVKELKFTAKDADPVFLPASTQQVGVTYLPLLYKESAAPTWQNSGFAQVFQQVPQLLNYADEAGTETGTVSGYVYAQDLTLIRQ